VGRRVLGRLGLTVAWREFTDQRAGEGEVFRMAGLWDQPGLRKGPATAAGHGRSLGSEPERPLQLLGTARGSVPRQGVTQRKFQELLKFQIFVPRSLNAF